MKTLFLLVAVATLASAQTDCSQGACYPPSGDLLLGRGHLLQASSTCGLTGSEVFCTPLQQWRMKCCPCDSRNPVSPLAHTVQQVLSTAGPDRWWQSKKDVNPVTLQLDLQNLFQLNNLVLSFKGPRPGAMVIERTRDHGQTWQPALYMASDCRTAFPRIAMTTPRTLDQTYCYTLPPVGPNPYRDHTVQFSPLDQYSYVTAPNGQKIQETSGLTGLRLRLTDLGEVPHLPGRSLSKFYALREMRIMGSCMCYGHANRCLPESSSNHLPDSVQVASQCECQHNTAGVNCEHCAELYNDLPWRAAEDGNTNACQRCQCNNHAQRCHFDQAVYEASGRRSGGVCEGCMHHTAGPKCDRCAPGYQRNPVSRMDRADACIRCVCSAEGTVKGGRCEDSTGVCQCKANVEGLRCDRCKRGYYGLDASNPMGCTKCSCSPDGSSSSVCDPASGQCPCRDHFLGLTCSICSPSHWKPSWENVCESCGCDPTKSVSDNCDQWTGQCQCKPGFGGRTCTECPDNTYGDPLIGCRPCECSAVGSAPGGCDKISGTCTCQAGIAGPRCDTCSRGHCDSFPGCKLCPSCFFSLDDQLRNLTLSLQSVVPFTHVGGAANIGPRIQESETRLEQIRDSLSLSLSLPRQINNADSEMNRLRGQMEQVRDDLSTMKRIPSLGSQVDQLQALLDHLGLLYSTKNTGVDTSVSSNHTGDYSAIKNAYDKSTDAAKKVDSSAETVNQSASIREATTDLYNQVHHANTIDLEKLTQHLASKPDITTTANQVCGSLHTAPCTPSQCESGELCPTGGVASCVWGQVCVGALPLANRAVDNAEIAENRLGNLSEKIIDVAEKLQESQETATQVRQLTEKLTSQMKEVRDELDADLKEAHNLVRELKDFLSDPSSNLNDIKEISDWILNAKLPLSLAALKRKLEELKKLAAGLPDSTAVLNQAEPQLDLARRLLQEAQDARDKALGVKDDVNTLLEGLGSVEGSLSGLEDILQDSMSTIGNLNTNLLKAKAQLTPAEKALEEIEVLTGQMKSQLGPLQDLLATGGQLAQEAQGNAAGAMTEANMATEDLSMLEERVALLKADDGSSSASGAGLPGERLQRLQEGVSSLVKDTAEMTKGLAGKADSLRKLQGDVLQKTENLEGLDAKLQSLLAVLRSKAAILSSCQG